MTSILLWALLGLAGQGDYAPADIAYGARLYDAQCTTCHGANGDGVGGVDLRSGRFRTAVTDQDLTRVILTGIEGTDRHLIEAARSFGARPMQIFAKVMLPSALPVIVTGLRLGLARGLVGVVVAELFGAKAGLGYLILYSAQTFDMAALFAGVLILAVAGVVSSEALKALERRLAPWRFVEVER